MQDAVQTGVDAESPVTRGYMEDQATREAWRRLIDHKLIEWGRNPDQFTDEGLEPLSPWAIQFAILMAENLCAGRAAAPTSVVPDAHGGIVFERRDNDAFEAFRFSADGTLEFCVFEHGRLVRREIFPLR